MNNSKLIYLYFLFPAMSLLSSCTSDTPNPDFGKGKEVTFDVSDVTRATTTNNLTEFAVFGDMKLPANTETLPSIVFNNTKVQYMNGEWSYGDVQYWFPQFEHSFVAVSPISVLSSDNTQYLNSKLSFRYTIPISAVNNSVNLSDLKDIVVATHRRLYNPEDANSTIFLRFSHILSMINLSAALDDNSMGLNEYIKIQKLEFSGVMIKAQYDILPASRLSSSQTDDMVVDMAEQENGNFSLVLTTPVKIVNDTKNVNLFADNDAIIMHPQVFATDSDSEIIVYYTVNEDTSIQQVSLSLKNLKWDSSKSYILKFTIEKNGVRLDKCEITPWNSVQGEEITVD